MKHRLSLFIVSLVVSLSAQAQMQKINTFAGIGTAGFSGDGFAATGAQLNGPYSVSLDQSGNLYIADYFNSRVRKVNTAGKITTIAGNGLAGYFGDGSIATSAQILPNAVLADNSGNVYISDAQSTVVRKVNSLGIISTVAGVGGFLGYTGDNGPAISAKLNRPAGLALDRSGRLLIADAANHAVRMVNSTGTITTIAGTGVAGSMGDGGSATTATLDSPFAIAVDRKSNVYIADILANRVRKIDASGIISTFAGTGTAGYAGDNGAAPLAELNRPAGVAVDSIGNVYIADAYNNVIRKVDTFGVITTVAGNGTFGFSGDLGFAIGANMYHPYGVAVNAVGSLFIADANNHRIRTTYSTAGVGNVNETALSIYPNPAANELVVSGIAKGNNIVIYNLPGQQVAVREAASGNETFNVAALPAGIYFVQVSNNEGVKQAARFVKE
jgi:sugar lactone lactonase YvrE